MILNRMFHYIDIAELTHPRKWFSAKGQLSPNFLAEFLTEPQSAHCVITINDSDSDSDVMTPANGEEDVRTEQHAVNSPGKSWCGDTYLPKSSRGHVIIVKLLTQNVLVTFILWFVQAAAPNSSVTLLWTTQCCHARLIVSYRWCFRADATSTVWEAMCPTVSTRL